MAVLVLCAGICYGQEVSGDTTEVAPIDSSEVVDTTEVPPSDTTAAEPADTLSDVERAQQAFEQRYREHQEEKQREERPPRLSIFDSLVIYFTSPRLNVRGAVDRSWYHDAGDYFRFDPSYFALNHQVTPMRSTVQPFGLAGNRLNLIPYGHTLNPMEHIPEPDGLVDMNAVPTALNHEIYLLPGPVGRLFGGRSAVASLVTRPYRPADHDYYSAFLADQGGFDYAFVRGRLSKLFTDGRSVDAAIEYRNADGLVGGRESDQYSYYGDFYFPIRVNTGLHAWGWLYDTEGPLAVWPEFGGTSVRRDRFNRTAEVSFTHDTDDGSRRYEAGYRHRRHGLSNTSFGLNGLRHRLNWTEHGGFVRRDWVAAGKAASLSLDGGYLEYDNGPENYQRVSGTLGFRLADLSPGWRYALSMDVGVVEDYPVLPGGSVTLFRDGRAGMVLFSLGFASRAPSMNELHLPVGESLLYGGSSVYGEEGNASLARERQLVGSLTLELGSVRNNLRVSLTGGRVFDGIEWRQPRDIGDSLRFRPINTDFDFASATVMPRIQISDFLTFLGGGSYHWVDYAKIEDRAYTPEYQAFSGLELHVAWPQRNLDLYAYGEVVYTGPYDGYKEEDLGENPVVNAKLSFELNDDYRMHFVFQNILQRAYAQRDYLTLPGRFFYFGFEWRFLN